MRVMHVVLSLKIGGLERMVVSLSCAQARGGTECHVCALQDAGPLVSDLASAGVRFHQVRDAGQRHLSRLWNLIGQMRALKPNVVHTHNPGANFYGAPAARVAGVPAIVCTRHGQGHSGRGPWFPFLAHRIAAVSSATRDHLLQNWQVPKRRVVTVHNGVETDRPYAIAREEARARLGVPDRSLVAVTVARMVPAKDHRTLLHAAGVLCRHCPEMLLLLVGDGKLEAELRQLARDLGLDGSVRFLGARNDVEDILPAADVFVLPSLTEGLSMSTMEAMAAGLPVVATAVGGNPQLVQDGETGRLVPPGDAAALASAVRSVIADRPYARRLGAAGRERVREHFSTAIMAQQYAALYDEVLRERGRSASERVRCARL